MSQPPQERFDALLAPHLHDLFRTASRLVRNRADADDLVQDTCVTACEQLAMLERAEHPHRWLVRVLYNRFIDGARRKKRLPVVAFDDEAAMDAFVSHDSGPEETLHQGERQDALQHAYLQLEETQRAVLALRAEGYGLAEIEAITGIGKEVLRARLHRARKSLARHLDQPEDEPRHVARLGSNP
jgi:RNA polymerase sigma-70 factor (ECF subfamily)